MGKFVKKVSMLRRTNNILWSLPRLHDCSEINDVRRLIARRQSKNVVKSSYKSFRTHSSISEPWIITDGNSLRSLKQRPTSFDHWSSTLRSSMWHTSQSVILYILIYCTNQDIATFRKSMNNRKSMGMFFEQFFEFLHFHRKRHVTCTDTVDPSSILCE